MTELTTLLGDTAWQLSSLATACEEYAAAVETARERTRALLTEVAQMIVEGAAISVIITGLTGGLAGGAAAAAAAARVRSPAPRFYALLVTLRAGVSTAAARLERARDDLSDVRAKLEKFVRVQARDEAGTIKHPVGGCRGVRVGSGTMRCHPATPSVSTSAEPSASSPIVSGDTPTSTVPRPSTTRRQPSASSRPSSGVARLRSRNGRMAPAAA